MRHAWLSHPATLVAALVLLLNDHLLKHAWSSPVTGKLSDVAGLVVAPPLVALLLCRRADLAATLLTGVLYTLVKTTETGAEAASHVWTAVAGPSRVLTDPTDLLALPALGLAWWIRRRSLTGVPRRWLVITTMPLAVLAVTATAAAPGPPAAHVVVVREDSIVVAGESMGPLASSDGGRTWTDWKSERASAALEGDEPPIGPAWDGQELGPGQRAACLREHCYQIVEGAMKVMRSGDGGATWDPGWEVSPGRVKMLERALSDGAPIVSRSLAVQEHGDGHVVVVANGRDGVAVKDADGAWRRLGLTPQGELSDAAAIPLSRSADVSGEMRVAALAAVLAALAGLSAQAARPTRRTRPWAVVALAAGGALVMAPWPYEYWLLPVTPLWMAAMFVGGVLLISAMIVAASLVSDAWLGARGVWRAVGAGVLVGVGVAAPFRAWSAGLVDDYGLALAAAALLGVGAAAAGLVTLRRRALLEAREPRPDAYTLPGRG
ncbi:hypothetical protein [Nonomuraea sp. NPDC049725]|uniref:hypothetical protein n=1 Tax=Nonomuraea sp. NPDC049725 TaxID=3154508 RepID=UPI003447EEC4